AIAAKISEILFVKDDGVRRDQFLHLESFELESRSIFRKRGKRLFDLTESAERARIVVVIMRLKQLLGKAIELLRVKRQCSNLASGVRLILSLNHRFTGSDSYCPSYGCQQFSSVHDTSCGSALPSKPIMSKTTMSN